MLALLFTESLSLLRHFANPFVFFKESSHNFRRYVLPLAPFCRKWGSESYWNLSQMTQLTNEAGRVYAQTLSLYRVRASDHHMHCALGRQWEGDTALWTGPILGPWFGSQSMWKVLEGCKECSPPSSFSVPLCLQSGLSSLWRVRYENI